MIRSLAFVPAGCGTDTLVCPAQTGVSVPHAITIIHEGQTLDHKPRVIKPDPQNRIVSAT
jgi:hypothetical protein